jgi:hypothetical protein
MNYSFDFIKKKVGETMRPLKVKNIILYQVFIVCISLSFVFSSFDRVWDTSSSLPLSFDQGDVIKSIPTCATLIDNKNRPAELSNLRHIAYAYLCYDSSGQYDEGPVRFDLNDPENLIPLAVTSSPDIMIGGTWIDEGRWLCCQHSDGSIWEINPVTGEMVLLGSGGTGLNDLAYDDGTENMYGASATNFYQVDTTTGNLTFIGPFGVGGVMMGLCCDTVGICYGFENISKSLFSIDVFTGAATPLAPLTIPISWKVNLAYDKDNDMLYVTDGSALYQYNISSGAFVFVGFFPAVVSSLVIPYNYQNMCPTANFTWTPFLPNPDELVFFNASSSYDPDGYITLYSWDWESDGIYDESSTNATTTHSWEEEGWYQVTLCVFDDIGGNDTITKAVRIGNSPPEAPNIVGPTLGKVGVEYNYTFIVVDPEEDPVYLWIEWFEGDPSATWKGPYPSGGEVIFSHSWEQKGMYTIGAKAKDCFNVEGKWGYLDVKMPMNKKSMQWFFPRYKTFIQ